MSFYDEEPRFTRGEYWLLEEAVDGAVPFWWLDDEPWGLEVQVNKPAHFMSRELLVETFVQLFQSGLIYAEVTLPNGDVHSSSPSLTVQEIENALDERSLGGGTRKEETLTYYGLTAKGGQQWERFAAPDWNRLIDSSRHFTERNSKTKYQFHCADKEWLEQYVRGLHYLGMYLQPETVVWEEVGPWEATYWKELPSGHRVTFELVSEPVYVPEREWNRNRNFIRSMRENRRWYRWK